MIVAYEKVYLVLGWFGDQEWVEGIYASKSDAEAEVARLWTTRSSDKGPSYARGLHKFSYDEYDLR